MLQTRPEIAVTHTAQHANPACTNKRNITAALGDLAEILTPDQRVQLAKHLEKTHGL